MPASDVTKPFNKEFAVAAEGAEAMPPVWVELRAWKEGAWMVKQAQGLC